jgi:hypothetical protein
VSARGISQLYSLANVLYVFYRRRQSIVNRGTFAVSKTVTPDEMLRDHLPYEIKMMRFAHKMLHQQHQDRMMLNSLIECFCTHARNLIDFFNKKDDHRDDALARDFVGCSYNQFAGALPEDIKRLRKKIHKQIAHITYRRTIADRIDDQFQWNVRDLIEKEIGNFGNRLISQSRYTKFADLYQSDFSYRSWPISPNAPTRTSTETAGTTYVNPSPPAQNYTYRTGLRDEPESSS